MPLQNSPRDVKKIKAQLELYQIAEFYAYLLQWNSIRVPLVCLPLKRAELKCGERKWVCGCHTEIGLVYGL
ncbi:hypothetical protein CDAR_97041 [Caerostris darwini]|uniref:Uncharacterized protein n=1 Tax=Caerostris darwini TaxID=1538125 RepID=A0AAV4QR70_9ARAC|nr:hypothetical protein CDAR_97041 [Caerostris darwini]